jgi:hypothetical protein
MQNSQLYRRGIVCPLDQIAEEQLRSNEVDSTSHVRFVEIPDEQTFVTLWRLGLFSQINSRCGTSIDDYGEEWVEASALADLMTVIDSVFASVGDSAVACLLTELRSLARGRSILSSLVVCSLIQDRFVDER